MSKLCGRPTPKGACKAPLSSGSIRCHRHMPKTEEEKAEYRAEMRALRRDDSVRDEARFTRIEFSAVALQHGLADERTRVAFDKARAADVALKEQIERHKAELVAAAKGEIR